VAIADFNGDGKADLAVAGLAGLYVLLGNGDGTFRAPTIYDNSGFAAESLAVADFNADGKLDIAWPDGNLGLLIFPGNGDGTFQAPVAYGSGIITPAIVAADFNQDGRPDVAMANQYPNYSLGVLLANPVYSPSTTSLTSSVNPSYWNQPVTLTATVSPSSAMGSVAFMNGNTTLATASLINGVATYTSALPAGTDSLTAVYNGMLTYLPSTGSVTEQVACAGIAPGPFFFDITVAPCSSRYPLLLPRALGRLPQLHPGFSFPPPPERVRGH
jgi:hypothetical protein